MKRIITAILAGILLNVVLATATDHLMHTMGVFPPYDQPVFNHGLLALAFSYRVLFMLAGGYLAGVIAREQGKKAALILGTIGSLLWLAGGIAMWDYAYAWYNLAGVFTGVPLTMAGWALYNRRSTHNAPTAA